MVTLTPTEFRVLNVLTENVVCTLTRKQIIHHVSLDGEINDRTIDKHISNLRQKLEDMPARPTLICTVVRIGYKFVDPNQAVCGIKVTGQVNVSAN
jgi:DNA-binding response OmpR family regulator